MASIPTCVCLGDRSGLCSQSNRVTAPIRNETTSKNYPQRFNMLKTLQTSYKFILAIEETRVKIDDDRFLEIL